MKKVLAICLLAFIYSCGPDPEPSPKPVTDQGCLTGVNSHGNRVLIRCCTQAQYQAGSNVNQGGIASWNNYTDHKWEKCSECQ